MVKDFLLQSLLLIITIIIIIVRYFKLLLNSLIPGLMYVQAYMYSP